MRTSDRWLVGGLVVVGVQAIAILGWLTVYTALGIWSFLPYF